MEKFKVFASEEAKKRNGIPTSKITAASDDFDDDDYSTMDDWYYSDDGEADNVAFCEALTAEIQKIWPTCTEVFSEPSIQGMAGSDYVYITMQDGRTGTAIFDWESEQAMISTEGPEAAARYYAKRVVDEIEWHQP